MARWRQATQVNSCNESARTVLQTSIACRGVELDSGDTSHSVCSDRLRLVPYQFDGKFLAFSVRSLSTTYDEYHGREVRRSLKASNICWKMGPRQFFCALPHHPNFSTASCL